MRALTNMRDGRIEESQRLIASGLGLLEGTREIIERCRPRPPSKPTFGGESFAAVHGPYGPGRYQRTLTKSAKSKEMVIRGRTGMRRGRRTQ